MIGPEISRKTLPDGSTEVLVALLDSNGQQIGTITQMYPPASSPENPEGHLWEHELARRPPYIPPAGWIQKADGRWVDPKREMGSYHNPFGSLVPVGWREGDPVRELNYGEPVVRLSELQSGNYTVFKLGEAGLVPYVPAPRERITPPAVAPVPQPVPDPLPAPLPRDAPPPAVELPPGISPVSVAPVSVRPVLPTAAELAASPAAPAVPAAVSAPAAGGIPGIPDLSSVPRWAWYLAGGVVAYSILTR